MVCGNQTHIDPASYFAPDAEFAGPTLLQKYWYTVVFPFCTAVAIGVSRKAGGKPIFSGLPFYAFNVTGAVFLGMFFNHRADQSHMRRDAKLYHYIKTHPEDFPPIERVKYKDLLEKWYPNRL